MRSEQEIFEDLASLCAMPGYVHMIAHFCFRDSMILYSGNMKPADMQHLFSMTRLIRTEISTLIGLLLKNKIDYSLPSSDVGQDYIKKTEELLEEIHHSMSAFAFGAPASADFDPNFNPFTAGTAMREPIFYGGESAYSFQYRDLSVRKYGKDEQWLRANKGFSIETAKDVVHAIGLLLNDMSVYAFHAMKDGADNGVSHLSGHAFTIQQVAERTNLDTALVSLVLAAFSVPPGEQNGAFNSLHDFNVANAYPLIRFDENTYILFQIYSLVEALYESPFYWTIADDNYRNTAMKHRGQFAEEFSAERLALVFGKKNVYSNVNIFDSKGVKIGEIDVLVLYANRAIVLQAKSKRLTLEARRGNDGQIKDDFKKSIQDSCDQAHACAKLLGALQYAFKDAGGRVVDFPVALTETYLFCIVADHYPALSFQTRQFLKNAPASDFPPPFVLDVFMLDAMTEMLDSPLHFLSYVDRRTKYSDKLMASHELTILSYHLKQNLWLDDEHDLVMLSDDISTDLDLAMMVRRENIPGARTPDGILTRFTATTLGKIVKQIEAKPNPATIDLGFMLLTLGEKTVLEVSKGIDELARRAKKDGKNHDLTIGLGVGGTGLTLHCNDDPIFVAGPRLEAHCKRRKYTQKAETWFGICVLPDASLRFGLNLAFKWEPSAEMEAITQNLTPPGNLAKLLKARPKKRIKTGRNDPCPCSSGKKYKHCCLIK